MGNDLLAIDLGTSGGNALTAKVISAGGYHVCAVLNNDSIKCWGGGSDGRLGQGNSNNIGDGANEMGNDLSPIDLGGSF